MSLTKEILEGFASFQKVMPTTNFTALNRGRLLCGVQVLGATHTVYIDFAAPPRPKVYSLRPQWAERLVAFVSRFSVGRNVYSRNSIHLSFRGKHNDTKYLIALHRHGLDYNGPMLQLHGGRYYQFLKLFYKVKL